MPIFCLYYNHLNYFVKITYIDAYSIFLVYFNLNLLQLFLLLYLVFFIMLSFLVCFTVRIKYYPENISNYIELRTLHFYYYYNIIITME